MRLSHLLNLALTGLELEWDEDDDDGVEVFTAERGGLGLRLLVGEDISLIIRKEDRLLALHGRELPMEAADKLKLLAMKARGMTDGDVEFFIDALMKPVLVDTHEEEAEEDAMEEEPEEEELDFDDELPPDAEDDARPLNPVSADEAMELLQDHFNGGGKVYKMPSFENQDPIEKILVDLGPMEEWDASGLERQVEKLMIASGYLEYAVSSIEGNKQTLLMSHLFARANHIRHERGFHDGRWSAIYTRLTGTVKGHSRTMGRINGFRRDATPRATWGRDAKAYWHLLVGDEPTEEVPVAPPAPKKRNKKKSKSGAKSTLENWQFIEQTRGKTVVMLGGSPRTEVIRRVEREFQFASVKWPHTKRRDRRILSGLQNKVRAGKIDVVIYLCAYIDTVYQDGLRQIAKDNDVLWIPVPHGYGTDAIKRAIENTLDGSAVAL